MRNPPLQMARESTHTIVLVTPPDTVNRVHELLETVWSESPHISPVHRTGFETAIIELASNVIKHANKGNPVECTVAIDTSDGMICATLIDTGVASDLELRRVRMPEGLAESGRGLAIIRALVDEVVYESDADVNYWRISCRISP